jgi:hypothetical protein
MPEPGPPSESLSTCAGPGNADWEIQVVVGTPDQTRPGAAACHGVSVRTISRCLLAERHGLGDFLLPNSPVLAGGPYESRQLERFREVDITEGFAQAAELQAHSYSYGNGHYGRNYQWSNGCFFHRPVKGSKRCSQALEFNHYPSQANMPSHGLLQAPQQEQSNPSAPGGRRPLKARPRRAVTGPGPGRPRPAGQGSPPS